MNGSESLTEEQADVFGKAVGKMIFSRLKKQEPRDFTLRMSNIGNPCARKLWLEKNRPESKEPLEPSTILKFLYGDLIEELVLFLAELSGHDVAGRQDEQEVAGIKGHRDTVIDGVTVDAKSASPFSFQKFKTGLTKEVDAFGYLPQLGGYLHSGQSDPIVTDKTRGAFLVADKVNGHLCLDFHKYDPEVPWEEAYEARKETVNGADLPDRAFEPKPDGYKNYKTGEFVENGNKLLDTNCSYCNMKHACYDNIRTFLSSNGPKYFTEIVKEPKMFEVKRD